MHRNPFWKISNYYWAHMHKFKNFNALHKQFFLFTHHKRDISHFLVVSPLCYPVVLGVNAARRAWFFPRLCSLGVYVFNALADCKMTLPKTRCPTLLLTSCCLDREGGGGGMITFLSTVRWRYRRHVAQLCCWRLATLTGRGVGGGW